MIIAKNEQMKKVLGLGYPSAPIYTVEEFGDRQVEIMQKQAKVIHGDGILHLIYSFLPCRKRLHGRPNNQQMIHIGK